MRLNKDDFKPGRGSFQSKCIKNDSNVCYEILKTILQWPEVLFAFAHFKLNIIAFKIWEMHCIRERSQDVAY